MGKYIKKADRIPYGPLARHGGYSVAHKDELLKRHPEIQRYLKVVRRGLIRDTCPEGEEHLTMARRLVLDRLMQKLATARLIETYLSENGFLRRDRAARKVLEAEPIMTTWLALNHQIRLDLQLLGLERKALDAELTVLDVIAEFDKDKAAKAAMAGKTALLRPVEGKTIEGADIVAGDSGTPTGKED